MCTPEKTNLARLAGQSVHIHIARKSAAAKGDFTKGGAKRAALNKPAVIRLDKADKSGLGIGALKCGHGFP